MSALYFRSRILAFVWALAICIAIPAFAQEKGGGVTMDEDHIVVHPMTKISAEDVKAINDVLKEYDKSFYKLQTYKDGKLKKTQGTLSDVNLDQVIAAELTASQAKGESVKTMQFTNPQRAAGATVNSQPVPGASTNPQHAPDITMGAQPVPGASTNPQRAPDIAMGAQPVPGAPTNPQRAPDIAMSAQPAPGASTNPQRAPETPVPGASTNPQHISGNSVNPQHAARDLIEHLKPILQKYSRK